MVHHDLGILAASDKEPQAFPVIANAPAKNPNEPPGIPNGSAALREKPTDSPMAPFHWPCRRLLAPCCPNARASIANAETFFAHAEQMPAAAGPSIPHAGRPHPEKRLSRMGSTTTAPARRKAPTAACRSCRRQDRHHPGQNVHTVL
jgi:hypothetical protein